MIRMLLVGYCFGIRSERRLCEEVHLNLAYRWFCRLGLEGAVPDHSTFSKNRHGRFRDSDLLRQLFEATATLHRRGPGRRRRLRSGRQPHPSRGEPPALPSRRGRTPARLVEPRRRRVSRGAGRRRIWRGHERGAFARVAVGPASRYTSAHGGQAQFCYATNYLIDVQNAVIVDVEASTAVRQAEVTAAKRMIERVHDDLGLWPRKLIADTGYGSAEMLAWLVHERDIHPHIPVFDKSARNDGTFARVDFTYDLDEDLHLSGRQVAEALAAATAVRSDEPHADGFFRYRASKPDCDACALKPRCCPGAEARKVPRSIHEGARNLARAIAEEDEWLVSRASARRSRCCSPTSNASSGSTACDYAVQTVPATSSTSPPQPRTSASWPS